MNKIHLSVKPNTNTTLSVLGVTATQVVLAGEDGATQSFENTLAGLENAKAGDVVTLAPVAEASEGTYEIVSVAAPTAPAKSAGGSGRAANPGQDPANRNEY